MVSKYIFEFIIFLILWGLWNLFIDNDKKPKQ